MRNTKIVPVLVPSIAYTAGDVVGQKFNLGQIDGFLRSLSVADDGNQGAAGNVLLFDSDPGDVTAAFSSVTAATDTITTGAAHGLAVGQLVKFVSGTGFAGLTAGVSYYVVNVGSSTTFKVSATSGGTAITVGTSSAGVFQLPSDNYPFAWPTGSSAKLIGVVALPTFVTVASKKVGHSASLGLTLKSSAVWGVIVTTGTPTQVAASDLTLKFGFEPNGNTQY